MNHPQIKSVTWQTKEEAAAAEPEIIGEVQEGAEGESPPEK